MTDDPAGESVLSGGGFPEILKGGLMRTEYDFSQARKNPYVNRPERKSPKARPEDESRKDFGSKDPRWSIKE